MQELDFTYQSIKEPATGLFKDKGSKFLAFAFPVRSEKEIKPILEKLKKEYFDARHHCYAYRLGANGELFKMSDDREPSGTAGKPILGQILSFNLTNVLVIVVRYFGGTLLGTSGLIKAYKAATLDALSNANIVSNYICSFFKIKFDYMEMNKVMKIIKDLDLEIIEQNFDNLCNILLKVNKKNEPDLLRRLEPLESTQIIKLDDSI